MQETLFTERGNSVGLFWVFLSAFNGNLTIYVPLSVSGGAQRPGSYSVSRHLPWIWVPAGSSKTGCSGLHHEPTGRSCASGGQEHWGEKFCCVSLCDATGNSVACSSLQVASSVHCTVYVFQVARSLGILDEVNRMKVVPGASASSSLNHKTARYMEVKTLSAQSGCERIQVWCGFGLDLDPVWMWFRCLYLGTAVFGISFMCVLKSRHDFRDLELAICCSNQDSANHLIQVQSD